MQRGDCGLDSSTADTVKIIWDVRKNMGDNKKNIQTFECAILARYELTLWFCVRASGPHIFSSSPWPVNFKGSKISCLVSWIISSCRYMLPSNWRGTHRIRLYLLIVGVALEVIEAQLLKWSPWVNTYRLEADELVIKIVDDLQNSGCDEEVLGCSNNLLSGSVPESLVLPA